MGNFNQQIKRIDYTIEELNKLNINNSYYFVSESLIKFRNILKKVLLALNEYIKEIDDEQTVRGKEIKENFNDITKILINNTINKFSLDIREIARKESSEAYILVDSLLRDLYGTKPIFLIIYASGESQSHGGTMSFLRYIKIHASEHKLMMNKKINGFLTLEQDMKNKENNIHLINYNPQDLKMNAFHWCLLYHEAFHIIDEEITPIDEFTKNEGTNFEDTKKNKEIMVDILSTIYCGLPYPYSLTQFLEENPDRDVEHLSPINRLVVAKKCLEQLKNEYESKYQMKVGVGGEGRNDFERVFIDSFDKVIKIIDLVTASLKTKENLDEDRKEREYIDKNFDLMYQHAKKILQDTKIKSFIEQINTIDNTVRTMPLDIKKTAEYCSLFIPPVAHPILLFNGLLHVYLQKDRYILDKRIEKSWSGNNIEIAEKILGVLEMSLKKWWAAKEYYSAQPEPIINQ
jgi:hypothetical protein